MRVIHKFMLADETLVLTIAQAAKVVRFARQRDSLFVWIEHDPEAEKVIRIFLVIGTGHPIGAALSHVQSCEDGQFIWHLYEKFADDASVQP